MTKKALFVAIALIGFHLASIPKAEALVILSPEERLPSISYRSMQAEGLGDRVEQNLIQDLKSARKEGLLGDRESLSSYTNSLLREMDLETAANSKLPIRLLKAKSRKIMFHFVEKNWDQVKYSVANFPGVNEFKEFAPYLKEILREETQLNFVSKNQRVLGFEAKWISIRVDLNKDLANLKFEVSSQSDTNRLEQNANEIHTK